MKYIQKTNYQFDLDQLNFEWNNIKDLNLKKHHWYKEIQTCLQYSETCVDKYTEGCGSIKRAGGRTEKGHHRQYTLCRGHTTGSAAHH